MTAPSEPLVALESTIVAHGLPYPDNLEIGRALEAEVRAGGAMPKTIAVVDGEPTVGITDAQLESIARGGRAIAKAGAADLAAVMASGATAATTVSATAVLAHRVGIRVFATGGIGGVHPWAGSGQAGDVLDVSSDLATLARLPIAVVCAGAKAFLDLPRTAEALEALGVLVVGYQTDELPAFYTRTSGIPLEHRADDPAALARILRHRFDDLGQGGVLVANPIPEQAALDPGEVEAAVEHALREAEARGVRGKAVTPLVLAEIAAATGGRSVAANRALALSNARLAAELAVCYVDSAG